MRISQNYPGENGKLITATADTLGATYLLKSIKKNILPYYSQIYLA